MCFSLEVKHTTSQPPKQSGRKPHQISKGSHRRFIKEPNPYRGTVETYLAEVTYLINGRPLYASSVEIYA